MIARYIAGHKDGLDIDGRIERWVDGEINRYINGQMDSYGQIDAQMYDELIRGWRDRKFKTMDEWKDGYRSGYARIDGYVYV